MVTRKCDRKTPTVSVKSNYNVEGNFTIDGTLRVNGKNISSLENTTINGVIGDIKLEGGNGVRIERGGKTITISSTNVVFCKELPDVTIAKPYTIYLKDNLTFVEPYTLSEDGTKFLRVTFVSDGEEDTEIDKFIDEITTTVDNIKENYARFEIVDTIENITEPNKNVIYLVKNGDRYETYTYVDEVLSPIGGDTSDYVTKEELKDYVSAEELASKDYATNSSIEDLIDSKFEGEDGINIQIGDIKESLSEIEKKISDKISFKTEDSLESIENPQTNVIYLIPSETNPELKEEYIYDAEEEKFELIGSSNIDLDGYVTETELEENYIGKDEIETIKDDIKEDIKGDIQSQNYLKHSSTGYKTLDDLLENYDDLVSNTIYWVRDKSSIEQYIKKEDGKLLQISGNLNVKLNSPEDIDKWELPWEKNCEEINDNLPELVDGSYLFQSYKNLTTFASDTSNMTTAVDMFKGCTQLEFFNGQLFSLENAKGMFDGCILNLESVENIVYSLESKIGAEITIGFKMISDDDEEEKKELVPLTEEARDKGWTIQWLRNGTEEVKVDI